MRKILHAFSFLTVVPLPIPGGREGDSRELGECSAFFPLVGLAQGVAAALALLLLETIFPPAVTAVIVVAGFALLGGGLHIDGLSDTFDALASRGSRERMLAIMKDGSAGPIGTAASVFVTLLKVTLLMSIFGGDSGRYLILILLPVAGKWSMTTALYHGESARPEGLGALFIEHTGVREFAVAAATTATVFAAALLWPGNPAAMNPAAAVTVFALLYVGARLMAGFFQSSFGGLTGDNLGAVSELGEALFLAAVFPFLTS